jgi:RimJ/RimL family protein N-acetyltransferase
MWAVEEKSTGRFVGRIGLQLPPGFPETEVAWMLGAAHWGNGFATEGARAAIEFGFSRVGKTKLISLIFPENERSVRLAERLGERYESDFHLDGHRLLMYSIHRETTGSIAS